MTVVVEKPASDPTAALSATNPAVARVDDIRALKFRLRTLKLSGNYTTGGENVTAAQCSLSRVVAVGILSGLPVVPGAGVAATVPAIKVAANRKSFNVLQGEVGGTGAAGDPLQEKTNAEAYAGVTPQLDLLVIGF